MNEAKSFPEFDYDQLTDYAAKWVNDRPNIPIKEVFLYRLDTSKQELVDKELNINNNGLYLNKYSVIFVLDNYCNLDGNDIILINDEKKAKEITFLRQQDNYPSDFVDNKFTLFMKQVAHSRSLRPHPFLDGHFINRVYKNIFHSHSDDLSTAWIFYAIHEIEMEDLLYFVDYSSGFWKLYPPIEEISKEDNTGLKDEIYTQIEHFPEYSLTKKGDYWHVRYENQTATIRDLNGMHYIATLLGNKHKFISCIELCQSAGLASTCLMSQGESKGHNLNTHKIIESNPQKELMAKYKKELKRLIEEKKRLEEIPIHLRNYEDKAFLDETEDEIENLAGTYKKYSYGHVFADQNPKKAQSNVNKAIKRAHRSINKAGLKELEKHLETFIKPDGEYGLSYSGDLDWKISM